MPNLTALQKLTAQAIINLFETGTPRGEYGQVTLIPGDRGHLTYGRSQTTLASGNLYLLIKSYCEAPEAALAADLAPFLDPLRARDTSLDRHPTLRALLKQAGQDPVMHQVQDAFFDRVYWQPAIRSADYIGVQSPLGTAIVYDGRIHGSWHAMRDRTISNTGTMKEQGEIQWFANYVQTRRKWLLSCPPPLPNTVYRMDTFEKLMRGKHWELALPLTVRGTTLTESVLVDTAPPLVVSAADPGEVTLSLTQPITVGASVLHLQQRLNQAGAHLQEDGWFGPQTREAVLAFQKDHALTPDGIAGPATWAALNP